MLRKLLLFKFAPVNRDLALLVIRVVAATALLLKHGLEKTIDFQTTYAGMQARDHYIHALGIGPTMVWAALTDGILTVLLIFGLATRWCALFCMFTMAGAWAVLGFPYFSSDAATHGEMITIYMILLLMLLLAGGGRYSLDAWLQGRSRNCLCDDQSNELNQL